MTTDTLNCCLWLLTVISKEFSFEQKVSFQMPEKPKTRPLSANRQRRQHTRRHSLNADPNPIETIYNPYSSPKESVTFYSGVDFRTTKEKIESLENEIKERKDDSTFEEHLNSLVLLQLYTRLEYGEKSIENVRAYLNLSKFYFDQRNLASQAKLHILNAREILEQLNIKSNDNHLIEYLIGFEVYLLLIKCSFHTKEYLSQREMKMKTKQINKKKSMHEDFQAIEKYLEDLKRLMSTKDYEEKYIQFLTIQFEIIINNFEDIDRKVFEIMEEILGIIDRYPSDDQITLKIDIYLRYGFYLVHFDDHIQEGLNYFKRAVELAEKEEERDPSDLHKYQLANTTFQWGKARVRANRLTDNTERKFQRAIELHRQVNDENDKIVLKIIDELATFYTKTKKYQDALNILCDSLPDKKRLFGDFSEEVIQTESRIGAIYLCECEYLNAAEHLKECLTLQEFVYGSKDPRTCQTRDALEILKKDSTVFRSFFSRTQDGIRQDRPAFRVAKKISYDKEDQKLLLTVAKKPPMSSRN